MICVIGNATLATDGSATIIDFLFSSPLVIRCWRVQPTFRYEKRLALSCFLPVNDE